jgi:hypothetical protein
MQFNYASTDIETSGLNKLDSLILEIGIVLDNSRTRVRREDLEEYLLKLPVFHCYVKYPFPIFGEDYALNMNKDIIRIIEEGKHPDIISIEEVPNSIDRFLGKHLPIGDWKSKIMFAGKNFAGFDRPFLDLVPNLKDVLDKYFIHRVHDPAQMFFDPNHMDKTPSLKECLDIAGYNKPVSHTAIFDSQDVIKCLRYFWDKN